MNSLASLPLHPRIAALERHADTLFNTDFPEDVLYVFDDIRSAVDAMAVAQLFYRYHGDVILSLSMTARTKALSTIVDYLEFDNNASIADWLLLQAFLTLGMKRAGECPLDQLQFIYCVKQSISTTNLSVYVNHFESNGSWGDESDADHLDQFERTKTLTMESSVSVLMSTKNIDERITKLAIANGDFEMFDQPDAIVSWFFDIRSYDQAMRLAMVFHSKFGGGEVICREASQSARCILTVMDILERYMEEWDDTIGHWLILNAFRTLGFKRASECEQYALLSSYCRDKFYRNACDFLRYDYAGMKQSRGWIYFQLQEYLYHPRFIQRWLDQGGSMESYLQ